MSNLSVKKNVQFTEKGKIHGKCVHVTEKSVKYLGEKVSFNVA